MHFLCASALSERVKVIEMGKKGVKQYRRTTKKTQYIAHIINKFSWPFYGYAYTCWLPCPAQPFSALLGPTMGHKTTKPTAAQTVINAASADVAAFVPFPIPFPAQFYIPFRSVAPAPPRQIARLEMDVSAGTKQDTMEGNQRERERESCILHTGVSSVIDFGFHKEERAK